MGTSGNNIVLTGAKSSATLVSPFNTEVAYGWTYIQVRGWRAGANERTRQVMHVSMRMERVHVRVQSIHLQKLRVRALCVVGCWKRTAVSI